MSLLEVFGKFVGFRVLEFFIQSPLREIHLKGLSRALEISSRSAKIYCDLFENAGVLVSERKGNLRIFRLNNDAFAVKELKKAYFAVLLKEIGVEKICDGCSSIAVYGSFASGEFDEKSDLDLLVIGDKKCVDFSLLGKIERTLHRNIQVTVLPFFKWKKLKKAGDGFAENVLRKHVLVKGVPL